jgi:hypothetical protein
MINKPVSLALSFVLAVSAVASGCASTPSPTPVSSVNQADKFVAGKLEQLELAGKELIHANPSVRQNAVIRIMALADDGIVWDRVCFKNGCSTSFVAGYLEGHEKLAQQGFDLLLNAKNDPVPKVREFAVLGLGLLDDESVTHKILPVLRNVLAQEKDLLVLNAAALAVGDVGRKQDAFAQEAYDLLFDIMANPGMDSMKILEATSSIHRAHPEVRLTPGRSGKSTPQNPQP